jgi:hypothetical protein
MVSSGISAGLEIRETAKVPFPSNSSESIIPWFAIAPSIYINWVENRTLFNLLTGHPSWLGIEPPIPARGVPKDVTRDLRAQYDEWNGLAFDASWIPLVMVVERITTAIKAMADAEGRDTEELLKLHRSVHIDAIIAFLTVYQERGFDTRIVFWATPV